MGNLLASLLLLLPALLCVSCEDSGEFAPGHSPALARSVAANGKMGAFAGEAFRAPAPPPLPEPPPSPAPPASPAPEPTPEPVPETTPEPPAPEPTPASEPSPPTPPTPANTEPPPAPPEKVTIPDWAARLLPGAYVKLSLSRFFTYDTIHQSGLKWPRKSSRDTTSDDTLREINKNNPEEAANFLRVYEELAARGNYDAMVSAGNMYLDGMGTVRNHLKACQYFRMAEEHYGGQALVNLFYLLSVTDELSLRQCLQELETGYIRNGKRLVRHGRKSYTRYGEILYLIGNNKAKSEEDYRLIHETLERLTPGDNTGSCHYVKAVYHVLGHMGYARDHKEAFRLYSEACNVNQNGKGYLPAQIAMADIYHFGRLGQARNEAKALQYYRQAAAHFTKLKSTTFSNCNDARKAIDKCSGVPPRNGDTSGVNIRPYVVYRLYSI